MEELHLREEYITLGQLLKAAGIAGSGVEAKVMIQNGEAMVNGEVDERRGRKLREGDVVRVGGTEIRIVR